MGRLGKERHFEVIRTVFAMAEERGPVPLAEAADAVGVDPQRLRAMLEPVLYLEYRDQLGEIVGESRAFLLDEQERIRIDEGHWLRNLAAVPPAPLDALRLFAAAKATASAMGDPPPELRSAVAKLDALLEGSVVMPAERPPCLDACVAASRERRTLRIRYTTDAGVTSDREVAPHHVFQNWGKWYVQGPEIGAGVGSATGPVIGREIGPEGGGATVKQWRVDRMHWAQPGDGTFDPPAPLDIPDRFDLSEHERTVCLRLPESTIDNLPTPNEVTILRDCGDGTVEADITVMGDHRLRHLLVAAGPDAQVLSPPEYEHLRREHAALLLRALDDPPA